MSVRIGYVNVNSLPESKFRLLLGFLVSRFDFLFVAEHWYEKHVERLANPAVIGATVLPSGYGGTHARGRMGGGVYLLASAFWKSRVLQVVGDQFGIVVRLKGVSFAGVYYPPYSLSCDAMESHLGGLPAVDLLLGDINTRFDGSHDGFMQQALPDVSLI